MAIVESGGPLYPAPAMAFAPPDDWSGRRFRVLHGWLPLGALALALAAVAMFGLDQRLADTLYAWEGGHWAFRESFATQALAHHAGRDASTLAWCAVLAAWGWSLHHLRGRPWRKPLAYLLLATLASTTLVAWIKHWSNMDCPWDLVRYGGDRPFVSLFAVRPVGLERARCLPSGHASAGYAWLALYFFLGVVRPDRRGAGLCTGLGLGLLFGVAQQLRGAHFLSHDLWTLAICWGSALVLYRVFWPEGPAP